MKSSKPLIILGSARKAGDTAKLVQRMFGPDEAAVIDLLDYTLTQYRYDGIYPPNDQFKELTALMRQHEQLVFATPVYWYAMSGLLKVLFDRFTDLVTIQKEIGRTLAGKQTFLIAVGADSMLPQGFDVPFRLTSVYLAMDFKGAYYRKNSEIDVKDEQAVAFKQLVCATNHAG